MSINLKFDRRVNIRTRATNRQIAWGAIGTAVLAHVVFFGIFGLRTPSRRGSEDGDAVTMLSAADFRNAREREGFRNWLKYHDPQNFGDCGFSPEVVGGVLRDVRPPRLPKKSEPSIPTRPAAFAEFREVPARNIPERTTLPSPPPSAGAAAPVCSSGKVTDGGGRELPLGKVRLPERTVRTVGRTVLRVLNGGGAPVLLLDRSCGDDRLDGFAIRSLRFLAAAEPTPEYIIVEWPEARK